MAAAIAADKHTQSYMREIINIKTWKRHLRMGFLFVCCCNYFGFASTHVSEDLYIYGSCVVFIARDARMYIIYVHYIYGHSIADDRGARLVWTSARKLRKFILFDCLRLCVWCGAGKVGYWKFVYCSSVNVGVSSSSFVYLEKVSWCEFDVCAGWGGEGINKTNWCTIYRCGRTKGFLFGCISEPSCGFCG